MFTRVRYSTAVLSFVSFVVVCFAPGCSGPPKHANWNNATGAEQYERLMWETAQKKDWKAFEHRLAPAFIGVDSSGKVFDRLAWVEHWKKAAVREYSLGELSVQPEGVDMVVTYVLNFSAATGSNDASAARARVVSVWQQVKSGWIQTACSVTPIKSE